MVGQVVILDDHDYEIASTREGGMGIVYLLNKLDGENSSLYRRHLAAKTFKPFFSRDQIQSELNIWAHLCHRNILPLTKIGYLEDNLAAISPWRQDGSLAEFVANKKINVGEIVNIINSVIDGLEYAWKEFEVAHLDIKPNNIFCGKCTNEYEIGDWGIARSSSDQEIMRTAKSKTYINSGTLPYMSPERYVQKTNLSCQADIFSLGIMAIELHTGALPFPASKPIHISTLNREYLRCAHDLTGNLSFEWQRWIFGCIAFGTKERYSSYNQVRKNLPTK